MSSTCSSAQLWSAELTYCLQLMHSEVMPLLLLLPPCTALLLQLQAGIECRHSHACKQQVLLVLCCCSLHTPCIRPPCAQFHYTCSPHYLAMHAGCHQSLVSTKRTLQLGPMCPVLVHLVSPAPLCYQSRSAALHPPQCHLQNPDLAKPLVQPPLKL
jgi:hypothetical protein